VARAFLNRFANAGNQVDTAVVHHDDVVAPESGNQALLDIGEEHLSSHGPLNHHWRGHLIVAQGAHEGDCLPCSERNGADHPDAPWSPPPQSHHIGANRSLVDKHQPGGIKHALLSYPASARAGHLRSFSFRGLQAFFLKVMSCREKKRSLRLPKFESYQPGILNSPAAMLFTLAPPQCQAKSLTQLHVGNAAARTRTVSAAPFRPNRQEFSCNTRGF
jgi:hypothetical protein